MTLCNTQGPVRASVTPRRPAALKMIWCCRVRRRRHWEKEASWRGAEAQLQLGSPYFAAVMMMLTGGFEILQGLSAIIKKHFYVVGSDYVYKINVTTWGWIHLILGVIVLLAGIALLRGALWARIVGITVAVLIALANFLWLPYYPVWAIVIIARERPRRVGSCCSRARHRQVNGGCLIAANTTATGMAEPR